MYRVTPLALGSLLGFLLIDTALAEHVRATGMATSLVVEKLHQDKSSIRTE